MKKMNTDDVTDRSLLAAVAGADQGAFDRLYHLHAARVLGYVKNIVGDPGAAEDLAVATMTTVWQTAASFNSKSRVSTWILGIARHKAIDELRSRLRTSATIALASAPETPDAAPAAIDTVAAEQLKQSVHHAIARLSAEHRQALRLAYFDELPYEDIAARLGIPANTVKSRVFYAKRELQRLLSIARVRRRSRHCATASVALSRVTRNFHVTEQRA